MPTAISTIFGFFQDRFIVILPVAKGQHAARYGLGPFCIHIHARTARRASRNRRAGARVVNHSAVDDGGAGGADMSRSSGGAETADGPAADVAREHGTGNLGAAFAALIADAAA